METTEWAAEHFIPDVAWQSRVSIRMRHTKNATNHKETSCGMKCFIDKPFRIVLRVAMYLHERLIVTGYMETEPNRTLEVTR